jgi:hypothetical protein
MAAGMQEFDENQRQFDFNLSPEEVAAQRERQRRQCLFRQRCELVESLSPSNTGMQAKRLNAVKRLLKILLRLGDEHAVSNACQATIAGATSIDTSTVKRSARWAESIGVLSVRCRRVAGHRRNRYYVELDRLAEISGCEAIPLHPPNPPPEPWGVSPDAMGRLARCHGASRPMPWGVSPDVSVFTDKLSTAATEGGEWAAAAESVRATGLELVERFLAEAQKLGKSAAEIIDAAKTYEANRSKFKRPGALFTWLREGAWPAEGVRSARIVRAEREKRDQAEAERRARIQADQAAEMERREETAALEKVYGPRLDAMSDAELLALGRSCVRTCGFAGRPRSPVYRYELLLAIHERTEDDDRRR